MLSDTIPLEFALSHQPLTRARAHLKNVNKTMNSSHNKTEHDMKARANTNALGMKSGSNAARLEEHAAVNTFEALLERKMQAAAAANKHCAGVDNNEPPSNTTFETANKNPDEVNQVHNDERDSDSNDVFNEQSLQTIVPQQSDAQTQYPNYRADSEIMEAVAQRGLVDESGAIPAFVPDIATEACVIGVIESNEDLEREEKREYVRFILKAVLCIVILVVAVAVPVTLRSKDDNGSIYVTPAQTEMPSSMPSESPTMMPTSERFIAVVDKLDPLSGEKLVEIGSPQYRAARWISEEDPMQLDISDVSFEQRYAMAVLYYSLNGDDWGKNNWLSEASECDWDFVGGSTPDCRNGCLDGKVCSLVFSEYTALRCSAWYLNNLTPFINCSFKIQKAFIMTSRVRCLKN
jgi:hypothetical protein